MIISSLYKSLVGIENVPSCVWYQYTRLGDDHHALYSCLTFCWLGHGNYEQKGFF
jgi:hypothetical protein